MRDRDVHRLIEKQEPELKEKVFKNLESELDLLSANGTPIAKKRFSLKHMVAIFSCVCLVTIATMLPFLFRSNDDTANRYCTQEDYTMLKLGDTIKDYAVQTNKSLLYLNWYDVAEEISTALYSNVNDQNDMICLKEYIVNGETGDIAVLYITDTRTTVDFLEPIEKLCTDPLSLNGITVRFGTGLDESAAQFIYNGYNYIIHFEDVLISDYVLDIISGMII